MKTIHEAAFFLFKCKKKTDEGHLCDEMREGLKNIFVWPQYLIYKVLMVTNIYLKKCKVSPDK